MSRTLASPWLIVGLAIVYAGFAVFSGLDRNSEYQSSSARFVPSVMQAGAFTAQAGEALQRGELSTAIAHASDGINRDPLDVRGHAILGTALVMQGEGARVRQVFSHATALGWRQPLVQSYWFLQSWRRGNVEAAMSRLDALLRTHPDYAPAQEYLAMMEGDQRARDALARHLAADTVWSKSYLSALDVSNDALRARARFLAAANWSSKPLGCERIQSFVRELGVRNYRADAERALDRHCPTEGKRPALLDPAFKALDEADKTGLGWRQQGGGDLLVKALDGESGGVEIANRSSVTQLALTQAVALKPGWHRFQIEVAKGDKSRVLLSLDCGPPKRTSNGNGELIATDCPDQILGIWARPGSGPVSVGRVSLDDSQPSSER